MATSLGRSGRRSNVKGASGAPELCAAYPMVFMIGSPWWGRWEKNACLSHGGAAVPFE